MIKTFIKLGFTAFGGPAAHIAMLEQEAVENHGWLSREDFLDLASLTNIVPGPNSSEMVLGVGYHVNGIKGLLLAGVSFMMPAILLVLLISSFFSQYLGNEIIVSILDGMKPVLFVMILRVTMKFFKQRINVFEDYIFLGLALILSILGFSELFLIVIMGVIFSFKSKQKQTHKLLSVEPISLWMIFLLFLKIGATLYGSGYVLLSYLQTNFGSYIENQNILRSFLIGELTPGPVFTSATALGVFLKGPLGGLVATLGIFLPSFIIMMILMPLHQRFQDLPLVKRIFKGVNLASIAILMMVCVSLAQSTFVDVQSIILSFVVMFAMFKLKLNHYYALALAPVLNLIFSIIV